MEISSLQEQLQSKEEFITLLSSPDDEDLITEIDVLSLQQNRYLFVGNIDNIFSSLRRVFPNSLFMDTDRFNLTGIQVDAIVLLVKGMSHSMYFKIKSTEANDFSIYLALNVFLPHNRV